MNAIETTGHIDAQHRLRLDEPLPGAGPGPVRVIILFPEAGEIKEQAWLRAASAGPAFEFLKEEPELYTRADGKPFHDQR